MAKPSKKTKHKAEGCKKNRYSYDNIYFFVFSVFAVDVIFFNDSDFFYTSSPIPDFIMT
jgi:hypothetical protein